MTTSITLIGATGLTGLTTLHSLLSSPQTFTIQTFTRRPIPSPLPTPLNPKSYPPTNPSTQHTNKVHPDLFTLPTLSGGISEKGGVYISCLGTTRRAAGGVAEQEKLDLGLNRDVAKRAREDGADTIILVSSSGSSATSSMAYSRMKGQLEEDVKAMGFKSCIILRPGILLGSRNEQRTPEAVGQSIFRGLRYIGAPVGQACVDAEDVGACIASFAADPPAGNVLVDNATIVRMAKAWREKNIT